MTGEKEMPGESHGGVSVATMIDQQRRMAQLALGFMFPGDVTCGDMIFSGHTLIIVLFCLTFHTYYPKTQSFWGINGVKIIVWVTGLVGILFIVATRLHYSIDVLLAVYLSVTLWNAYHKMAEALNQGRLPYTQVWLVDALILHPCVRFLETGPDMALFAEQSGGNAELNYDQLKAYNSMLEKEIQKLRAATAKEK